jgi:hypothetical protein
MKIEDQKVMLETIGRFVQQRVDEAVAKVELRFNDIEARLRKIEVEQQIAGKGVVRLPSRKAS